MTLVAALLCGTNAVAATDEQTIVSLRHANNHALKVHDARTFAGLWAPKFVLISGDGSLYSNSSLLLRSYEDEEFKDRGFVTYDREPDVVQIASDGKRAAERGHWIAVRSDGKPVRSGVYLASWIKTADGWRIQWESYVGLRSGVPR